MLDEQSASGSLFNLLICNRTPQPPSLRINPNNKKNLIISHTLVYNNIMVHKNIDITLMSIVAEGQGNTVGLIAFVYSNQISTIISNKIR